MELPAAGFHRNRTNLVYDTIRMIWRNDERFPAWARQNLACIVTNLPINDTGADRVQAQEAFRELVDRAFGFGGSYFLKYHRWVLND